jgi:nucleotide-binding universal stress UspA family protein
MRVLAAVDLGPETDVAIGEAAALAARVGGELAVVHALRAAPRSIFGWNAAAARAKLERLRQRADELVRARVEAIAGRLARVYVDEGPETSVIATRADVWGADVVVLGGWGHLGHGVLRHAHGDLLVAKPTVDAGPVLAAIDPSYKSHRALRVAAVEARQRGTTLEVARAVGFFETEVSYLVELGTPAIHALDRRTRDVARSRLAESLDALGIDATPEIVDPPAAAGIVHEAARIGAELVVVGHHERAIGRGVAEKVARTAPCSVLIVRE